MSIDREKYQKRGLTIVQNPETIGVDDSPPESVAAKFGDFIAPTLTGTIQDIQQDKGVSLKQAAGSAMELGSFFLPAGWIFRGLSIGSRAIRAAQAARKVAKVTDTFTDLSQAGKRARSVVRAFGRKTKRAAQVGGVSGALAGGGRALGEEDITPSEFVGQTAIGGGFGVVAGASLPVLAAPFSLATMGGKGLYRVMSQGVKRIQSQLNPQDAQAAKRILAESYENSFVADKTVVNNKLDSLMIQSRKKGGPTSKIGLLEELSEGGFIPVVEGKLANMRPVIDEISDRIARRAKWRESFLEPIKTRRSIETLRARARDEILERTDVDADRALRQLESVIESIKTRFGSKLSAVDFNRIAMQMNQSTRAFNKEQFIFDTQVAVGRAANETINELVGKSLAIKTLNRDMSKLFRMKDTASIFHNRAIDEGELVKDVGRWAGISFLATPIGLASGAVGGLFGGVATGGSLFIAALAAQQGSRFMAKIVRNARFNPKIRDKIRQAIDLDEVLKNKLLKEATGKDKKVLNALFSGDNIPSDI